MLQCTSSTDVILHEINVMVAFLYKVQSNGNFPLSPHRTLSSIAFEIVKRKSGNIYGKIPPETLYDIWSISFHGHVSWFAGRIASDALIRTEIHHRSASTTDLCFHRTALGFMHFSVTHVAAEVQ